MQQRARSKGFTHTSGVTAKMEGWEPRVSLTLQPSENQVAKLLLHGLQAVYLWTGHFPWASVSFPIP